MVDNHYHQRHCLENGPCENCKFGEYTHIHKNLYSAKIVDLHQKLIIYRVVCKECLLQILQLKIQKLVFEILLTKFTTHRQNRVHNQPRPRLATDKNSHSQSRTKRCRLCCCSCGCRQPQRAICHRNTCRPILYKHLPFHYQQCVRSQMSGSTVSRA